MQYLVLAALSLNRRAELFNYSETSVCNFLRGNNWGLKEGVLLYAFGLIPRVLAYSQYRAADFYEESYAICALCCRRFVLLTSFLFHSCCVQCMCSIYCFFYLERNQRGQWKNSLPASVWSTVCSKKYRVNPLLLHTGPLCTTSNDYNTYWIRYKRGALFCALGRPNFNSGSPEKKDI